MADLRCPRCGCSLVESRTRSASIARTSTSSRVSLYSAAALAGTRARRASRAVVSSLEIDSLHGLFRPFLGHLADLPQRALP